MRRALGIVLAVLCAAGPVSWTQPAVQAEISRAEIGDSAQDDRSVFERISDWFATLGKSPEEKDRIVAEREARRDLKEAGEKLEQRAERVGDQLEDAGDRVEDRLDRAGRN